MVLRLISGERIFFDNLFEVKLHVLHDQKDVLAFESINLRAFRVYDLI